MQSGKYDLDSRDVELEEVLQVVLTCFAPAPAEVGVALESRFDPNLPTVKGDPAKLRQAFGNLLGNAIKFTPRGGTARVEARASTSGGACVHVRDTGPGMSAEEIAVALTPFGQVDASHSRWREAPASACRSPRPRPAARRT
jgi:signal transduction histidine kinase